jgi:hypothetical protein
MYTTVLLPLSSVPVPKSFNTIPRLTHLDPKPGPVIPLSYQRALAKELDTHPSRHSHNAPPHRHYPQTHFHPVCPPLLSPYLRRNSTTHCNCCFLHLLRSAAIRDRRPESRPPCNSSIMSYLLHSPTLCIHVWDTISPASSIIFPQHLSGSSLARYFDKTDFGRHQPHP